MNIGDGKVRNDDASPAVEQAEACPPPLACQEVLAEFHAQAGVWYLDRPRYRLTGRLIGDGRPLYLLNGFGGTHEIYALLVWLLRDQFRCVLWDFPGTAAGSTVDRSVTIADLAEDVEAIARTCGDASFDLFAPSFGALVALELMLSRPKVVRRAVLQGGCAHRALSRFERWLVRSCRFFPGTLRQFPGSSAVREHNHRRWFPPFDTTRWQFLEENAGRVPVRALAWQAGLIRDSDLRERVPGIRQPVMLIDAEGESETTRNCQTELAGTLPNATVETVLGTGQYSYLTHPHRLAKILRGFFNGEE